MAKRRKNVPAAPAVTSWDEVDFVLACLRRHSADIATMEAAKERELAKVKETWDPDIEKWKTEAAALEQALSEFAETHQADLDAGARSRKLSNGVVGFRLGNPALATLKKWTWAKVLAVVFPASALDRLIRFAVRVSPWGKYVRVDVSLDKPAIAKLPPEKLAQIGCRIVQEDRFYYEINAEPAKSATPVLTAKDAKDAKNG